MAPFFMENRMDLSITAEIRKVDSASRIVRGFASVASAGGADIVDSHGDVIPIEELRMAAHEFVRDARRSKVMHDGGQIGEVVESVIVDKAMQQALGIDLGLEGWWIAMKVADEAVWKRVASGELRAFSIGGRGIRKEVTD